MIRVADMAPLVGLMLQGIYGNMVVKVMQAQQQWVG